MPAPVIGDAFGEALLAELDDTGAGHHVVERDDGFVEPFPAEVYFAAPAEWHRLGWHHLEREGLDHISGRVLDVGAGAGRVSLELQERGLRVTALDVSPGAIEVCRRRGVERTFEGTVADLAARGTEPFDAFVLYGNNLGLMGSPEQAPRFLETLASVARPGAVIVGTNRDAAVTDDPAHLGYHALNRERGRNIGHLTLRTRHRGLTTAWFDLLFAAEEELRGLAAPAGWEVEAFLQEGAPYLVVLRLRS